MLNLFGLYGFLLNSTPPQILASFRTSSFGRQAVTLHETELCIDLTLLNLQCQEKLQPCLRNHLMTHCPTHRVQLVCSYEMRRCSTSSPVDLPLAL